MSAEKLNNQNDSYCYNRLCPARHARIPIVRLQEGEILILHGYVIIFKYIVAGRVFVNLELCLCVPYGICIS